MDALIAQGVHQTMISRQRLMAGEITLADAVVESYLAADTQESRTLISTGRILVSMGQGVLRLIQDPDYVLSQENLWDERGVILRGGVKNFRILRIEG